MAWKFTSEVDFLIESVGSSTTLGKCNYYDITNTNTKLREFWVGGCVTSGSTAGISNLFLEFPINTIWYYDSVRSVSSFFSF